MSVGETVTGEILEAALGYAAKGIAVFPCQAANKRPHTMHGLKDASTDADTIRTWWARWPDATIGMPTGERTKLWVLDVDDPEAVEAVLAPPETRRVETGKGYHLYFKFDPSKPVRNAQRNKGKWPFPALPGAETRGEGGYVILPPSLHPSGRRYAWHGMANAIAAPAQLLRLIERKEAKPSPGKDKPRRRAIGNGSAYGLAALEAECDAIRDADHGAQEGVFSLAARKIGQLVSGGELDEEFARDALIDAAEDMVSHNPTDPWTSAQIHKKVDDRMAAGKAEPRSAPDQGGVKLHDFHAYMPGHSYIFAPTGEHWPAVSVNSRIPPIPLTNRKGEPLLDKKGEPVEQKANAWLDEKRAVEQVTWIPDEAQVIPDKIVSDGGWIDRPGCNVFNLYRPAVIASGDGSKAGRWLDHVRLVYPDNAEHLIRWLAHRVQRPSEKINHALVLGGSQGIGKDTILEPVKAAIGPWNMAEVSPTHLLGRFNGFVKSVILRVSEARDLGDVDRFAFYDHMKTYTAAPPDVLRVDEKHLREYSVFNVCGVIITSNHKSDGLFLPADDRRHYVAWSNLSKEDFEDSYWRSLWQWYQAGGVEDVAAYLRELDLSDFDPKAPPPKTPAFWEIVSSNQTPEDAELADALETLSWPNAVTIAAIAAAASQDFALWLGERRNARRIPHRLEQCGYVPIRNDAAQDGLWKVRGKRCAIYARHSLALRDRYAAAEQLIRR